MCTAATYKTKDHYFGRTLDLEYHHDETVTIVPRRFPFSFRCGEALETHHAMIGMAYVVDGYPLYYDACNEKGLSVAGLSFPHSAVYQPFCPGQHNIASFELIPWLLGQCSSLDEARLLLERSSILYESFLPELPASPLHWLIADASGCITVEPTKDGLQIFENPVGILTNEPPFACQILHLSSYRGLSSEPSVNHFAEKLPLPACSKGMGALGLPGDLSSPSRFVRAAFVKMNSVSGASESESVSQFFHILRSVEQPRGCVHLENDLYETTVYTSCCNTDRGIYYYTTYDNSRISCVSMDHEDLNSDRLICYPLTDGPQFHFQN